MGLFSLEHGRTAHLADLAVQGGAVAGLSVAMLLAAPVTHLPAAAALVLAGAAAWTAAEYALHRFVLHGLQPFAGWHAEHHRRPQALIGTPTLLSLLLVAALVLAPLWWLAGPWRALALTLGVQCGYLAYSATHHAVHHGRGHGPWLKQHRHWHALHHHAQPPGCYGVTTRCWDHVFGSLGRHGARAAC